MRPLKMRSIFSPVVLALVLTGCGGEEPTPQPPNLSAVPSPGGAEAPKPAAAPTFPKELNVDFASLIKFPDLQFEAIGTIAGEGDPRAVLMDSGGVNNTSGQPASPSFWVAKPPAQFIVNMPTGRGPVRVDTVTVEDAGGDRSFPLCSVSVKTTDQSSWHPPLGLTSRKELVKTPQGEWVRTIIQFDEVQVIGIRVSIPAGNSKQPDHVYIRDIDIIGDMGG